MDSTTPLVLDDVKALVKQLVAGLETHGAVGSFSPAVYDTAWLARIKRPGPSGREAQPTCWLFPQCFEYLLRTQEPGGGWPAYASGTDAILNTLAAVVALREHRQVAAESGDENDDARSRDGLEARINRAEASLDKMLQGWDVDSTVHVGFEILVPSLLAQLRDARTGGETEQQLEFPGRARLMELNGDKLARFRPEMLYTDRQTTLVHSLEAFVGKIDYDRVSHHLDARGSMMASPSATAAYLIHCSAWDAKAERYLADVVAHYEARACGGVPSAFPSLNFEIAWVGSRHTQHPINYSRLTRLGFDDEIVITDQLWALILGRLYTPQGRLDPI